MEEVNSYLYDKKANKVLPFFFAYLKNPELEQEINKFAIKEDSKLLVSIAKCKIFTTKFIEVLFELPIEEFNRIIEQLTEFEKVRLGLYLIARRYSFLEKRSEKINSLALRIENEDIKRIFLDSIKREQERQKRISKKFVQIVKNISWDKIDNLDKLYKFVNQEVRLDYQALGKNVEKIIKLAFSNLPQYKLYKLLEDRSIMLVSLFKGLNQNMLLSEKELEEKGYKKFIDIIKGVEIEGYKISDVKVSRNPALIQKDAWSLATIEVNRETKEVTLYIHEAFLEALNNKSPPEQEELLGLLVEHEIDEYLVSNVKGSKIYENFTNYLIKNGIDPEKDRTSDNFHKYLQSINSPQIKLLNFAEGVALIFTKFGYALFVLSEISGLPLVDVIKVFTDASYEFGGKRRGYIDADYLLHLIRILRRKSYQEVKEELETIISIWPEIIDYFSYLKFINQLKTKSYFSDDVEKIIKEIKEERKRVY